MIGSPASHTPLAFRSRIKETVTPAIPYSAVSTGAPAVPAGPVWSASASNHTVPPIAPNVFAFGW